MLKPFAIKRAIFIFVVIFPVMLVVQYKGLDSTLWGGITAGICGGLSVVIFPDPEHLKKIKELEKKEEEEKQKKKED